MALNIFKWNYLTPLHFKGLKWLIFLCQKYCKDERGCHINGNRRMFAQSGQLKSQHVTVAFASRREYLLHKNCESLVFERLGEVDVFGSFWTDCQSRNDHVCLSIDEFADHSVPRPLCTSITLQTQQWR